MAREFFLCSAALNARVAGAQKYIQVLAFQKSWRSFSPFTVCILAQRQCRTQGGGAGARAPPPPQEAVSALKKIRAIYDIASIYGNGLGWFCRLVPLVDKAPLPLTSY